MDGTHYHSIFCDESMLALCLPCVYVLYSTIFPTFKLHLAATLCIAIRVRDRFADDVAASNGANLVDPIVGTQAGCL